MSGGDVTLIPRFLGEEGQKFFTLQYVLGENPTAHIVFIPPFAEEMNRCRSLVATQARSFARSGYSCTLIDFYGTGDSQGQLRDASLTIWKANIDETVSMLQRECPAPVILWGLRLGGLIALDYAVGAVLQPKEIILWQPVSSATLYVTQVLRQRVASLMVRDLPPETTKEIRQRLADGEDIEVAGYTLSGALVRDIEGIDLSVISNACTGSIFWLEHVAEVGKDIGLGSRKVVDQLAQQNNRVELRVFSDPPIWQLYDRELAPQLLAATDGLLL